MPSKADILPPAGAAPVSVVVTNHFHQDGTVTTDVQSSGGMGEAERMARGLEAVVRRALIQELQPGGLLHKGIQKQQRG